MTRVRSLCITLLLFQGAGSLEAQDTRRVDFPEHGFSLSIPATWQRVSDEAVEAFERAGAAPAHLEIQTIAAFQAFQTPRPFTPPYVLVKMQRVDRITAAELSLMARSPMRLVAIQEWLDHIAESYGTRYGLETFAWNERDGILWIVSSGVEEPFPEIVSVSGAVVAPEGAILVAYRAFAHSDLRLLRDTVRSILLSARRIR